MLKTGATAMILQKVGCYFNVIYVCQLYFMFATNDIPSNYPSSYPTPAERKDPQGERGIGALFPGCITKESPKGKCFAPMRGDQRSTQHFGYTSLQTEQNAVLSL